MINAENIYESLLKANKLSRPYPNKETCIRDIEILLNTLYNNPSSFINLCRWQYVFGEAIERKNETTALLETFLIFKSEMNSDQINLVLQALNLIHTNQMYLSGTADELLHFHTSLFSNIDQTAEQQYQVKAKADLEYILIFFERASAEKNSTHIHLICWQQNILEALGFDKISLIRFLITIKIFNAGKYAVYIDESVKMLLQSFKPNKLIIESPSSEKLSIALADFHINLFQYTDAVSAPKYRSNTLFDGKKHFEFLQEAFELNSMELFVNYIAWVYSVLSSLNIPKISLIRFLVSMRYIIKSEGGEIWQAGIPFIDKALLHLTGKTDSYLQSDDDSLSPVAAKYLQFLILGQRKDARLLIFEELDKGMPIKDIYINIFQATQYEIGKLWERNKLTVAQEHYCTASTQMIMSQLYPHLNSNAKPVGKAVVVTCIGNELHELGIRIIADFLEMEGWNTYYLGANSPINAILSAIDENKADVLALSVTLSPHLKQARKLIEEIRVKSKLPIKIIVGGYPFLQDKELWKKIGADAYAATATSVHHQLTELFN